MSTDSPNSSNNLPAKQTEFLLYKTEDGRVRIEARMEDETVWLTQASMAELYQTTSQNVTQHLKSIYEDGELEEAATCKHYLQVQAEGARDVRRKRSHDSQGRSRDCQELPDGG
jgi:hypothetical protein